MKIKITQTLKFLSKKFNIESF